MWLFCDVSKTVIFLQPDFSCVWLFFCFRLWIHAQVTFSIFKVRSGTLCNGGVLCARFCPHWAILKAAISANTRPRGLCCDKVSASSRIYGSCAPHLWTIWVSNLLSSSVMEEQRSAEWHRDSLPVCLPHRSRCRTCAGLITSLLVLRCWKKLWLQ